MPTTGSPGFISASARRSAARAMTFFQASPQEHLALAKHLTAEVKTEEFVAGKGVVEKWERIRRQNHWLDTLYNASAAGHLCGVRLVDDLKKPARQRYSLQYLAEIANRPTARELAGESFWDRRSRLGG